MTKRKFGIKVCHECPNLELHFLVLDEQGNDIETKTGVRVAWFPSGTNNGIALNVNGHYAVLTEALERANTEIGVRADNDDNTE
jgi:hypothetical protein